MLRLLAVPMLLLAALAPEAAAQRFGAREGDRPVQSVTLGPLFIDFEFDGDEEPILLLDFNGPAFAVAYSRPNVLLAAAYGRQDGRAGAEDLRLIDLSLDTWGRLFNRPLGAGAAGQTYFFVPVLLFSNYRSVTPTSDDEVITDGFNVTTLGLGAGVGLAHTGRRVQAEARAHPGLGLATSSLTDALGHARLAEADVQLHLARLFGRAGLTLGYTVRIQVWNVNASNLFPELTDELFDYRGTQHLLRAGINF